MGAATQMIGGGAGLVLAAGLNGELARLHLHAVTSHSWLALAYLIVFGSWVGFSAYIWLLKVSTPSLVSTYAFVNPVVAVFLGWAMGGEPVTSGMIAATVVIVAGVVIITLPLEDWRGKLIRKRVETPAT
jgi:drug/metabolite transporter (DMT)-like permease